MKRLGVVLLSCAALAAVGGRKLDPAWDAPYQPTRLEWLALQCNIHHGQRHDVVHTSFVPKAPDTIQAVIKFSKEAKADAALRRDLASAAKEYVHGMAKAMHWRDTIDVQTLEVNQ